jgi:hypothetical protein
MRPVRKTVTVTGPTAPIPLDLDATPFNIGIGVVIPAGSSATYTVEHTFDDVFANNFNPATATWLPHATLSGKSATSDGNYAYPITAVRLNVAAVTGQVVFNVLQAGGGI